MVFSYANGVFVESICFIWLIISGTGISDEPMHVTARRPIQQPASKLCIHQVSFLQLHTTCVSVVTQFAAWLALNPVAWFEAGWYDLKQDDLIQIRLTWFETSWPNSKPVDLIRGCSPALTPVDQIQGWLTQLEAKTDYSAGFKESHQLTDLLWNGSEVNWPILKFTGMRM